MQISCYERYIALLIIDIFIGIFSFTACEMMPFSQSRSHRHARGVLMHWCHDTLSLLEE